MEIDIDLREIEYQLKLIVKRLGEKFTDSDQRYDAFKLEMRAKALHLSILSLVKKEFDTFNDHLPTIFERAEFFYNAILNDHFWDCIEDEEIIVD